MKNKFYHLVAYHSSGDDYCMGCHMGSYSSDFVNEFLPEDAMIQKLVELATEPRRYAEDDSWEVSVYLDGEAFFDDCNYDGDLKSEDERKEIVRVRELLKARKAEFVEQRELAEKAAKKKKQDIHDKQERKEDLADLKRLQAKYPDGYNDGT